MQGPAHPNPQGGAKAPSVHEHVGTNVDARATLEARRHDRDEASLDATIRAEVEGMTLITTAARRLSLWVPTFSARLCAGQSSRPGSDRPTQNSG